MKPSVVRVVALVLASAIGGGCQAAARLGGGSAGGPATPAPAAAQPAAPAPGAPAAEPAPAEPAAGSYQVGQARELALPGEDASDMPAGFVAKVRQNNWVEVPPNAPQRFIDSTVQQVAGTRNYNYAKVRPAARAFAAAWQAYEQRKAAVDALLAKALAHEKAGRLAEAQAVLEPLAPERPVNPGPWSGRAVVEARDAEVPALEALARLAVARRSADHAAGPILLRVAGALWGRRPIADRDSEQKLWLANDRSAIEGMRAWWSNDYAMENQIRQQLGAWEGHGPGRARVLLLELLGAAGELARPYQDWSKPEKLIAGDGWPKVLDDAAALVQGFERDWSPFRERRRAVVAAITEADALGGAGKADEASARLRAVITPAVRDAAGKLPITGRGWVDARDAELAAIEALASAARGRNDWRAYVDTAADLWTRRRIASADAELAAHILRGGKHDYIDTVTPPGGMVTAAYDRNNGPGLVDWLFKGLADAGLPHAAPQGELKVARGKWMMLALPTTNIQTQARVATISGRTLRFNLTLKDYDKHCRQTNRVDRVDSDGKVYYQEICKYSPATFTADATLAEAAPAWTADPKLRVIHVIGNLVKDGGPRSWKLQRAAIVDLRFMYH